MTSQKITEIIVCPVMTQYRKELGKNAFGDNVGTYRTEWLVRARTDGGAEGLTIANKFMRTNERIFGGTGSGSLVALVDLLREVFLGKGVDEFLTTDGNLVTGVQPSAKDAFWDQGWMSILAFDLLGQEMGVSSVDLLGGRKRDRVFAYDTTLYFQDILHGDKGAGQVGEEAAAAWADGYRHFKIKTGRGGRWMIPEEGMKRDAEVVQAVRTAIGPDARIMVDANFGYDGRLDLLEDFVRETLGTNVFWLEEMVTANVDDYRKFRDINERLGCEALLVCGEVDRDPPSPVFKDLVEQGLIDGFQPDIVTTGFSRWQALEEWLESTNVRSIPHNFGNGNFGTRADLVFGAASETFISLEDERHLPSAYDDSDVEFSDGTWSVPTAPGLGLKIDEEYYAEHCSVNEVVITA